MDGKTREGGLHNPLREHIIEKTPTPRREPWRWLEHHQPKPRSTMSCTTFCAISCASTTPESQNPAKVSASPDPGTRQKVPATCAGCGTEFLTDPSRTRTKYCSKVCGNAARVASGIYDQPHVCVICGSGFMTYKNHPRSTCGPSCFAELCRQKAHLPLGSGKKSQKTKLEPFFKIKIDTAKDLTAPQARELLSYEPDTGLFYWRHKANRRNIDKPAGYLDAKGYSRINIDGKSFQLHRLAWLITYGSWPLGQIDHIDGCRDNNRLLNLREATQTLNQENRRVAQSNNKIGLLGVYLCNKSGRYLSQIQSNNKQINLGEYDTKEDAHKAYVLAKRRLHAGCTI